MTRNRMEVWDQNYVTVIMCDHLVMHPAVFRTQGSEIDWRATL